MVNSGVYANWGFVGRRRRLVLLKAAFHFFKYRKMMVLFHALRAALRRESEITSSHANDSVQPLRAPLALASTFPVADDASCSLGKHGRENQLQLGPTLNHQPAGSPCLR